MLISNSMINGCLIKGGGLIEKGLSIKEIYTVQVYLNRYHGMLMTSKLGNTSHWKIYLTLSNPETLP